MDISRRKFLTGFFTSGASLLFTDSMFVEKFMIETNEYDIGVDKKDGGKIRLIQISDVHLKKIAWYHEQLAERVNKLKPDLIIFTGDIVEDGKGLLRLDRFLKLFDHDISKASVVGNWERFNKVDLSGLGEVYGNSNCDLLVNKSKTYILNNKRLTVTGMDDMISGQPDFTSAVCDVSGEENHIVLCHCPAYRDYIKKEIDGRNRECGPERQLHIDYVFSGHSHGGQVNIMGFTPFLPAGVGRYIRGWYKEGRPALYVSKGIGTSIFPIRFGARAEISVFDYYVI